MLNSDATVRLYHEYAKELPIIDFHCHIDPGVLACNEHFPDMYQLWLGGDHYKWREPGIPSGFGYSQKIVQNVCYFNAKRYFGF